MLRSTNFPSGLTTQSRWPPWKYEFQVSHPVRRHLILVVRRMKIHFVILFLISIIICGCTTTPEKPETLQSASENILYSGWDIYCWTQRDSSGQNSTQVNDSPSSCKNELAKPHLESCVSTISNIVVQDKAARNFRSEIIDCMRKRGFNLDLYVQILNWSYA